MKNKKIEHYNKNIASKGPSEMNRDFRFNYPEISDEEALRIANGMNVFEPSKNESEEIEPQETGPSLNGPTKKEVYGKEYRGSGMFRRGLRKRKG